MASLQTRARRAGLIYLVMSIMGVPSLLNWPHFIVKGDATETARRIAEGASVYRLVVLGDLGAAILFVVLGWSLYHLFESVDRKQARLLMLLVAVSGTIGIIDSVLLASPLVFEPTAALLSSFSPAQVDALSFSVLRLRSFEVRANEALWGLWLIPFGILVIRSGFIPKLLGIVLLIASAGYIAMSVAYIAFPAYLSVVERVGSVLIQGELT